MRKRFNDANKDNCAEKPTDLSLPLRSPTLLARPSKITTLLQNAPDSQVCLESEQWQQQLSSVCFPPSERCGLSRLQRMYTALTHERRGLLVV